MWTESGTEKVMSTRNSHRRRFESGGLWSALAVLVLMFSVYGMSAGINSALPTRAETTHTGQAVELRSPAGEKLVLTPPAGWTMTAGTSANVLSLTSGNASIEVTFTGEVPDLGTFTARQARRHTVQTPSIQTASAGTYRSGSGFAGSRATAVSDGKQGELLVLAKDSKAVTVLTMAEPGQQPDPVQVIDSMRLA